MNIPKYFGTILTAVSMSLPASVLAQTEGVRAGVVESLLGPIPKMNRSPTAGMRDLHGKYFNEYRRLGSVTLKSFNYSEICTIKLWLDSEIDRLEGNMDVESTQIKGGGDAQSELQQVYKEAFLVVQRRDALSAQYVSSRNPSTGKIEGKYLQLPCTEEN